MIFTSLMSTVQGAIAAHPTFAPNAATTVFKDLGDKKNIIEAALDSSSKGAGYAISVWPPARGHSDGEMALVSGIDCLIVVRFEISPIMLTAIPNANLRGVGAEIIQGVGGDNVDTTPFDDADEWVNSRIQDIVAAVLSIPPENNMQKFQLASDAFELINFDPGLLAYHIRFVRMSAFGGSTS
jgi:hypothetical protein